MGNVIGRSDLGGQVTFSRTRSKAEFCIDAFVEESGYFPATGRLLRDPRELSPPLERLVCKMDPSVAWRAWVEGSSGWFIEGHLSASPGGDHDRPTMYLIFRDNAAVPVAAGVWSRKAPAQWDLLGLFSCDALASNR